MIFKAATFFPAFAGILTALGLCCTGRAADPAAPARSPYQGIVDRNLFQLQPPPPTPAPAPSDTQAPAPKIFLTGLTTLAGRSALIKASSPARPGEAPRMKYYVIPEGGCQDGIQVIAIDEKAGAAKLDVAGTPVVVNLKDNAAARLAAAGPAGIPAAPGPNSNSIPPVAAPGAPVAETASAETAPVEKPRIPAQFHPRIVPTVPSILTETGGNPDADNSPHRHGFDEHGL